jgi:hypothetical protein
MENADFASVEEFLETIDILRLDQIEIKVVLDEDNENELSKSGCGYMVDLQNKTVRADYNL